jgi:hypothetical protein
MPKKNSANADTFDPLHDIDLVDGKLTKRNNLKRAFDNFKTTKSVHLCVFFHGGLVSRAEGLKSAADLIQGYSRNNVYPFFFIWNSDLLTVLKGA